MKRAGLIIFLAGGIATLLLGVGWILGFVFAGASIGSLVHLLLVLAILTGIVAFVGLILFVIGLSQKA